jgi:hypothetical protein
VLRSAAGPEGAVGAPRNAAGSKSGKPETGAREAGLGRAAVGNRQNANGQTDGAGAPAEKRQQRHQQWRDVPDKRD